MAERRIPPREGPGLRKTTGEPLYREVLSKRFRSSDAGWKALLEEADIVSEGASRFEEGLGVWYGSTSLIVAVREETDLAREELAAIAREDLHLRLRAVRYALTEAEAKCGSRLGPGMCDVRISPDPAGLRIEIDVAAPILASRARGGNA